MIDQPDGGSHTITIFEKGTYYYVIEGVWWMISGIHGPFTCHIEALRWANRMYEYIWKADHLHPAPEGLKFEFYSFNEENDIPGLTLDEYVEQVKGRLIDIDSYGDVIMIASNGLTRMTVVYTDKLDFETRSNFQAFSDELSSRGISNIFHYAGNHLYHSKEHLFIKYIEPSVLKIGEITIHFKPGDSEKPILKKIDSRTYEMSWFPEPDRRDEFVLHRFKPCVDLLIPLVFEASLPRFD